MVHMFSIVLFSLNASQTKGRHAHMGFEEFVVGSRDHDEGL